MAMVIVTMTFGQIVKTLYPVDQPVQDTQDRTGWIGGAEDYNFYMKLNEGDRISMRLPACGELPAGNLSVTKVAFRWQPTGGTYYFDPNFRILIFAGGNSDWIDVDPYNPTHVSKTPDTTVQGNLLYSQTCMCSGTGWQEVELTHPVAIPSDQEIWIAVEALGFTCCLVSPDMDKQHPEWWGQHLGYSYIGPEDSNEETPVGYYWHTLAHLNNNNELVPGKYALRVLIDDGEEYVYSNDWLVEMYSLETLSDERNINYLYVDQYMLSDSLYLAPALWNMGPDANTFDGEVRMWIENPEIEFLNQKLSETYTNINISAGRGWTFEWMGGLLAFSDMEEKGLTFPFDVCFSFEPYGLDPNLSNNRACAQITDVEPEDPEGISETSNTLTVSPNPASTYIKVGNAAGSRIAVYNIAGQEVLSVASAEANETLSVSHLTAGLYFVRVVDGNEVSTAKVSIVR